jgi:hypothetical protein
MSDGGDQGDTSNAQEKAIDRLAAVVSNLILAGRGFDTGGRRYEWDPDVLECVREEQRNVARLMLAEIGLVAVDLKLVEEYRQERARDHEIHARVGEWSVTHRGQELRKLIADAVIAALEPKPRVFVKWLCRVEVARARDFSMTPRSWTSEEHAVRIVDLLTGMLNAAYDKRDQTAADGLRDLLINAITNALDEATRKAVEGE